MPPAAAPANPTDEALAALTSERFTFFTGVADSLVGPLIARLSEGSSPRYRPAVREDTAIGFAAGAYLAGGWPCVLMQNSGLGYCLNALTSLNLIYQIPTLLIVGYRGYQRHDADAPEHLVMGRACEQLLTTIGVPVHVPAPGALPGAIHAASQWMREHRTPSAVLVRPDVLGGHTA
ncbi:MAG: sulfopyruvate decarboxylase subunit alpha [Candidatus Omnitrophica bacterium]|nr:sulfopyruvate decarboxylase subunit alpha [Candidatus Omnitrophota bacterium]